MDSSFDPETSLSSLAKKCLNIDQVTKKEDSLSNLTAKYNSSKKKTNVFGFTANSRTPELKDNGNFNIGNKAIGDGFINSTSENPINLSSSEDESDAGFQGLSLVALAAKHKSPIISTGSSQSKSSEQDMLDNSSEDEYSGAGFIGSLVALAAKHKGIQNTGSKRSVSPEIKEDMIKIPGIKNTKANLPAPNQNLKGATSKDMRSRVIDEAEKSGESLNPRYISAHFSDDSDSDDSFTLGGLVLKQARQASHSESGTVGHKSQFKPKELQRVANFHRHYSKSESDQFAVTQMGTENVTDRGFRSESSTSLGSLKGSDSSKQDFEFLLGCQIPHSFKSKHMGLTSSLGSVQVPQENLNSSFSDPDVSIKERSLDKSSFQPDLLSNSLGVVSILSSRDIGDMGGINLACAIKSSSSTSVAQDYDNDVEAELMDEEIVTLLDNMAVDEDGDVNKSNKSTLVVTIDKTVDCCLDARPMLKVKSKLQTVKCSSFGKVVCKQWRPLETPYIRREKFKSPVIPFKFTSPSPDDVMAGFLDRRLQSSL